MTAVNEPDELRLRPLAERMAALEAAEVARNAVVDEYGPTLKRFEDYQRRWSAFRAMEHMPVPEGGEPFPRPDTDPELEVAGLEARRRIVAAAEVVNDALHAYVTDLSAMVANQTVREGDTFRTPYSKVPLTVAKFDQTIGEVTLTADGRLIIREQHNWDLDEDRRPIIDPDFVGVRYERWWQGGLRVSGAVHPETRRIVSTD